MIDLCFPLLGEGLPADHGYALYAALSRALPKLHEATPLVRVAPVPGAWIGEGRLRFVERRSVLRLRLPPEVLPDVLPLAGKPLEVLGCPLRVGVPQVYPLAPVPALWARLVTIKNHIDAEGFLAAARRDLEALGVSKAPSLPAEPAGPHAGQPKRRVLRVKAAKIVGFALAVEGLSTAESLALQQRGLGGRGKLGCGFFLPMKGAGA